MHSGRGSRQRGFSFLLLLVVVAVMTVTAGVVSAGRNMARRNAEQALLLVGEDLRMAIANFRAAGGVERGGPAELTDLLRDPRVPGARRFLRRIPVDPLTGRAAWGVVRDAGGDIVAVHSLADGQPIKRDGFEGAQLGFENASSYAQWLFGIGVIRADPLK